MTLFLVKYTVGWISFCLIALVLLIKDARFLASEWQKYWSFLTVPWKLFVFVPAILFVTFAGRFTNDETWDMISGGGMSILTFLTAAWSVGIVYKVLHGERNWTFLVIAIALGLFSSSWFYDGYLLLRDGAYTHRWLGNLMLLPIIYLSAGLLLNLEAKQHGFSFSFLRSDWPSPPLNTSFLPLVLVSIPLILVAAYILLAFVGWNLK